VVNRQSGAAREHLDPALAAPPDDDLVDAAGGRRTPVVYPELQVRAVRLGVTDADPDVPVEGGRPRRAGGWRRATGPVGAENLCHQPIFMNHASGAVAPPYAEVVQHGDAI
jgi:hypothetical protein